MTTDIHTTSTYYIPGTHVPPVYTHYVIPKALCTSYHTRVYFTCSSFFDF